MRILYIGDVVGQPGLKVVEKVLPELKAEKQIDFTVAQSENVTDGRGISPEDFRRLQKAGVDFCTGGNWSLHHNETIRLLDNPDEPIIRPANYPDGTPGLGYKYFRIVLYGTVLVVSLLGQIVGKDSEKPVENPLHGMDRILEAEKSTKRAATIVNFHGDFSSEKLVIGQYLDGRVTAAIGDHWHVPSADAEVLPRGTAHITDVGMCGSLDSCLGVKTDVIIRRWQTGRPSRNELELSGRMQFNALLIESDDSSGLAKSCELIRDVFSS